MTHPYQKVAVGGTFDRLHVGHEQLLFKAFETGKEVCIGLTTPKMHTAKAYADLIESYETRRDRLNTFLQHHNWRARTLIVPLADRYGPTLHDHSIEALVVTPHTLAGASKVNKKRELGRMKALPIIQAELVRDDEGRYVSSTRIREGRINRQGQSYAKMVGNGLILNKTQKALLSEPQGTIIQQMEELSQLAASRMLVVVGDVSTQWCLTNQVPLTLAVVDGKTKRKAIAAPIDGRMFDQVMHVANPAGELTLEACCIFDQINDGKRLLVQVEGEEDLVALGAVLMLPLESTVLYGQRGKGIVMMKVSESLKEKCASIINNY